MAGFIYIIQIFGQKDRVGFFRSETGHADDSIY